jgi:hypothetical protein
MACNDNVVRIGLRHSSSDRAHTTLGNQFDADGRARIDPLQVEDQLGQIFNGVNVMMRRRADERDPGLRMAQARDQLGDLVARQLAAFAGLGALGDLDFDFLGMGEIFSSHAKASGGHLLHLIVQDGRRPRIVRIMGRIFPALAGIGTRPEDIHSLGDGLVRFRAQRTERHGGRNESGHDGGGGLHLVQRQLSRGRANL